MGMGYRVRGVPPRRPDQLESEELDVADLLRPGLLCRGDDALRYVHPFRSGLLGVHDLTSPSLSCDCAAAGSRYDFERMDLLFRASPRQTDIMIEAGTVTNSWLLRSAAIRTRCPSRAT
jgi:hypothetical protein